MLRIMILTILLISLCSMARSETNKNIFKWDSIDFENTTYVSLSKVKEFYDFDKIEQGEEQIILSNTTTIIALTPSSHRITINDVKFFTYHPIKAHENKHFLSKQDIITLLEPILHPQKFPAIHELETVILDPGHGGHDKGAAEKESQLTLAVAKKLQTLLKKKGIPVIMTREQDQWLTLAERVNIANTHKDAILISLHFNSGPRAVKGIETYYLSSPVKNKALHQHSLNLSIALHSQLLLGYNNPNITDRRIRRAKFSILKKCNHPSVLIEAGFLTNPEEATIIESDAYQNKLAKGIAQGIEIYRSSLQ